MRRILFMVESGSLGHIGRVLALSENLDSCEVHFAFSSKYHHLIKNNQAVAHNLSGISNEEFTKILFRGGQIFSEKRLRDYIDEDLKILSEVNPDLVVGDLRLSLAFSARKLKIPYVCITNSYWSSFAEISYPPPDWSITRILGMRAATILFEFIRPKAFQYLQRQTWSSLMAE